jgi:hypothetical protein
MSLYSGYGNSILLERGDALAPHPFADGHVVTLEYEVHGKILKSGGAYDNRFVSIAFIESRKIVHWRDQMDSLAAWTAQPSLENSDIIDDRSACGRSSPPGRG